MTTKLEKQARETENFCRGCGQPKDFGIGACIVCWGCWGHPILPFKYYNGSLDEWLKELSLITK